MLISLINRPDFQVAHSDNNIKCLSLLRTENIFSHVKPLQIMQNRTIEIKYKQYPSPDALPAEERQLLDKAIQATSTAYSPYSHFCVGAAVLLANGATVTGSNQENVAYPSGLCAERTAMFAASARYPKVPMRKIAIVGKNQQGELCAATPCGACRQVMSEYQDVAGENIEIILYSEGGTVLVFDGIDSLLPLRFSF